MSIYIDQKYVSLISSRLDHFTKKKENLYNFRCPYCGDSQKNKRKARGYIYQHRVFRNNLYYKCQNCGSGHTLGTFIKFLDVNLFQEYQLERFKDTIQKPKVTPKPVFHFTAPKFKSSDWPLDVPTIESLDDNHYAKAYIIGRKIPKIFWGDLRYCPDFKALVNTLLPGNTHILKTDDPRIIIPFYNKDKTLIAIQGRSLTDNSLRYITIKLQNVPKIWGLDKVDLTKPIFVVEGPLDGMFLPNCIAAAGSDLPNLPKKICIFIFDNEPRNKEICKRLERFIYEGYTVACWHPSIREKDINEMFLAGKDPLICVSISLCKGLEAKLKMNEWRKC